MLHSYNSSLPSAAATLTALLLLSPIPYARAEECSGLSEIKPSCTVLDLSYDNLSSLPEGIFQGLSNLQELDLYNNNLSSLPQGIFQGLSNLQGLNLNRNNLSSLPQGIFQGLSNLQTLSLADNNLSSLPQGIFQGLSNLQGLFLDENNLSSLPQGIFQGLSNLQRLSLGGNNLTSLPQGIFQGLSNLQRLSLGGNNLTSLPQGIFQGLSNLQRLSLYNNNLSSLPQGIFQGLSNLQWLSLDDNNLSSLPQGIFQGLSNLQGLSLYGNNLSCMPELPSSLISLYLYGPELALNNINDHGLPPCGEEESPGGDPEVRVTGAENLETSAAKQALDTWLPGLGRTVAEQALDAVQGRFQPRPQSSLEWNLAGQSMVGTPLDQHLLAWAKGRGAVTEQQLVEGTSFDLALAPENGAAPGFSFWARGDLARFDREEDDLSLDGNVTTALVGGDWGTEQWSAGAALARSWGSGSYNSGEEEGELSDGSLMALLPYGHYELNPQLSLWGMAGYGWGNLSLTPEGQQAMETDINLSLAAVGLEGLLLDGGREGLSIRSTADALLVNVSSEESGALAETESDVSRLRLGLEAVRSFLLENDASLAPMVEVALRQDGGDAETGFGLDLGAGLDWSAPRQGIRAELEGRVLLYHAAEGFQASGIAASLEWDPTPSTECGPSLSLKHGVGAATGGGMAALLSPAKLPELASSASSQGHQFQALLGYGFAPWGEEGLSIRPEIGLGLSSRGREYNLSWSTFPSVQSGEDSGWEVSTTVKRQENNDSHPSATHSLALHFSLIL